ncbi:hypothetical protein [Siminovitchia terrae]|uniref:hypothetical protein n=1 Tax=Siminovitchia terrae TaxID=1914933 RepID=UPI00163C18B9|nr:hypothetical protein [Siminovitchia terrae]GIN90207.1 hypothetical protein J22TS1_12580 [Siminovitchia terrae]
MEGISTARIAASGNSKNTLNARSKSFSKSDSAVKADAEQEQEQEIAEEEG